MKKIAYYTAEVIGRSKALSLELIKRFVSKLNTHKATKHRHFGIDPHLSNLFYLNNNN